jgi:hypothetical protein
LTRWQAQIPWQFIETEKIAFSGQERVPVLVDDIYPDRLKTYGARDTIVVTEDEKQRSGNSSSAPESGSGRFADPALAFERLSLLIDQKHKQKVLRKLRHGPGFYYVNMQDMNRDDDFSDEVHPRPRVIIQWVETACGCIKPGAGRKKHGVIACRIAD